MVIDFDVSKLSEHDVKAFMSNPIWQYISTEIRNRLDITMQQMRMAPIDDIWGTEESRDKGGNVVSRAVLNAIGIRRLQGMAAEDEAILEIPDSILSEVIANKTQEEGE